MKSIFTVFLFFFLMFSGTFAQTTIIVDNVTGGSATYAESGSWNNSSASGYYGTKSRVPANSNNALATATFRPVIPVTGIYKVYENHAAASNREDDALFTIVHRNGSSDVLINQKNSGANFAVYLGQYEFEAGTTGYVRLTERTNTGTQLWVNADAIKFVYQGATSGNAEFSASPLSQTVNGTVTFTDLSTLAGITAWLWQFGDGTTSTLQHPQHIYTIAGTYSVTLTVTNATETKTLTKSNYITITSPTPPPPATGNFLTNPGAETGSIAPWYTYSNGPALQVSSTVSHSGTKSFYSTNRTQYYHGPACSIKSLVTAGQLVSGQRYTFSVWVRHHESTSKVLALNLKKVDGSGTQYITLENETVAPSTWVKIVKHYPFAINGTLTGLELYVISASGTTFSFYADDFEIRLTENYTPPAASTPSDFIRASENQLVSGDANSPVVLKGINLFMPTDATDTPEIIWNVKSVSQEDFNNIATIGFNSIRLAMYYKMFEDDTNPGIYKEDGWHWLDRVIEMAKAAGLTVLLDMHAPPGGYQSDKAQGFSAFWGTSATDPNTANQNRLIALWKAIAGRYKHEPAIAGYDLINEPRPHNSEEWYSYAEQIISAIRTVDANHLIDVETPFISNYTQRLINDNNILYDGHFYTPWEYAVQYSAGYNNAGEFWGNYSPENPSYVKYVGGVLTVVPAGTSGAEPFNVAYLQNNLAGDLIQFTSAVNVPSAVGEYGLCHEMFNYNVGAIPYMTDLTAIFDGNNPQAENVSRYYFSYHGSPFSIYTNWLEFQPNQTEMNASLKNWFSGYFQSPPPAYPQGIMSGSGVATDAGLHVFYDAPARAIVVKAPETIGSVILMNISGKIIHETTRGESSVVVIPVENDGVVLAKVTLSSTVIVKKVFIP